MGAPGMDKAFKSITKWMRRDDWSEPFSELIADHIGPACADLDIEPEDLESELGSDYFTMALACAIDDLLASEFEPEGRNVVDDYLKRRGWNESVPAKRFLEAMRRSVMSLYEVTDTVPGRHLVVTDLVRGGDPIVVEERMGSRSAARWDRMAARVLSVNNKNYFSPGLLPFPMEEAWDLVAVIKKSLRRARPRIRKLAKEQGREDAVSERSVAHVVLSQAPPIITQAWLHAILEARRRPRPRLTNKDGDELLYSEVRFPVPDESLSEVERRLDGAAELERHDRDGRHWTWLGEQIPTKKKKRSKTAKHGEQLSFASFDEEGRLILGTLELRDLALVLSLNSRARAKRGEEMLAALLKGLAGPPVTSFQSPESDLDDPPEAEPADAADAIPPEVAAEVTREHLDRHYRACLDEQFPVLDGKTPRQAARSKAGRERLVEWLKYLENGEARRASGQDQEPYDFEWMWQELGISALRK